MMAKTITATEGERDWTSGKTIPLKENNCSHATPPYDATCLDSDTFVRLSAGLFSGATPKRSLI